MKIIGKCSICGGNVIVPEFWHGIYPPIPKCDSCHAVKEDNLPIIPMRPATPKRYSPYFRKNPEYFW